MLKSHCCKEKHKKDWKAKINYQTSDYCKVKVISDYGEYLELERRTLWKITSKAIIKRISLISFLIIFQLERRGWFWKS